MSTIGKVLTSLTFLAAIALVPLGCVTTNEGNAPPKSRETSTSVGGQYGVNVNENPSGTKVTVGGNKGVVVDTNKGNP